MAEDPSDTCIYFHNVVAEFYLFNIGQINSRLGSWQLTVDRDRNMNILFSGLDHNQLLLSLRTQIVIIIISFVWPRRRC